MLSTSKARFCAAFAIVGLCIGTLSFAARGQSPQGAPSDTRYVPSLASLMTTLQLKHIKLWFAGRLGNWPLADYELDQIKHDVSEAAALYPGIPGTDVTAMGEPLRLLNEAIEKKNEAGFAEGFRQLTASCNACHESIGRGFIVIQVPTSAPMSNQSYMPPGKL